jgi:hypothetical protein
MNLLKLSLASALLTVGIALSAPLSAAQIGGPVVGPSPPPPPPNSTWTAVVRWYQPQWINNVYYTYTYATITSATYGGCHMQLMSYAASPNVQVMRWCTQQ